MFQMLLRFTCALGLAKPRHLKPGAFFGTLAQLVERCFHTAKVTGSNPVGPTMVLPDYPSGQRELLRKQSGKPFAGSNPVSGTIAIREIAGMVM